MKIADLPKVKQKGHKRGRKVAGLRKQVILSGSTWPFEKERTNWGGMKIADLPKVKQKGHKRDKIRLKRHELLEEKMKEMPKMIEEYREKVRASRRGDVLSPYDKLFLSRKAQRIKVK